MVSQSKVLGKSSLILITVGSTDFQFDRLFSAIDDVLFKLDLKAKLIVQKGPSSYKWRYKNKELFTYLPPKEIEALFKKADKIITHGGLGSIYTLSKQTKIMPLIVARNRKYKEQVNNHQLDDITHIQSLFPTTYKDCFLINEDIQTGIYTYLQNKSKKNVLKKYLFSSKINLINKLEKYINTL